MADESKLHFAVQRAAKAEALLKDDLLQEAFEAVEEAYKNQWLNTGIADTEARERLWQAVRIVKLVHGHLARVVAGFDPLAIDPAACVETARTFGSDRFRDQLRRIVARAVEAERAPRPEERPTVVTGLLPRRTTRRAATG